MDRYVKFTHYIYRFSMITAPLMMVVAMILLAPQQQLLASLEGCNLFLRSIAGEPGSWNASHVAMLLAVLLFPLAFIGLYRQLIPANFWMGVTGLTLAYVGFFMLGGQLAVDFVYGAITSNGADLDAARDVRLLIFDSSSIQIAFNMVANIGLILGWTIAAVISLIYATPNRLFGILVLAGWITIIVLHGKIPYIEAVGHSMMTLAMILAVRSSKFE